MFPTAIDCWRSVSLTESLPPWRRIPGDNVLNTQHIPASLYTREDCGFSDPVLTSASPFAASAANCQVLCRLLRRPSR